jgi:hypothetical protein
MREYNEKITYLSPTWSAATRELFEEMDRDLTFAKNALESIVRDCGVYADKRWDIANDACNRLKVSK